MKPNKTLLRDSLGWGLLPWVFGYILGIIAFMVVPVSMIGWVITPIAAVATVWVLMKKIEGGSPGYYFVVAISWTIIAVALDYLLIVKLFNPPDGYYKLDVYLYYGLTLILPVVVGLLKPRKSQV